MGVAKVLGIPGHKVVARTKRVGGGFGGKETRAINLSCAAAVPAYLLRRAVRLIQDRDEDMHTSGHRHPFLGKYKVRALRAPGLCRTCLAGLCALSVSLKGVHLLFCAPTPFLCAAFPDEP